MSQKPIERLLRIMARLRDPEHGCPWDRAQDFRTIVPHTIEEAYEVAEAAERGELGALRDELGDLLFQVVFLARLAEERGAFDFDAVASAIADKLEKRHPHVFGDEAIATAAAQTDAWEAQKAAERAGRGLDGALDGVPAGLPALTRALKLGRRAARVGFDWPALAGAREKIDEEVGELDEALQRGDAAAIEHEIGDLLTATANLARHAGVDPEQALRSANRRFEDRFREVEAAVAGDGRILGELTLDELERYWQEAKKKLES